MTRIGTGFVAIEADFGPFWRDVAKEMGGSNTKFDRAGRDAARSFASGFRGGSKGVDLAGSFGGGGGLKRTTRDLDAFGGAAAGATATIGGFRIALAALVPITIGFGGAAVAATSALAPLVGLAAAAGNALGAAAQGMGVFALASMGVADALKEQIDKQMKSASAAISNAASQRAAARAIESAQDGIRNATRALDEALRDERLAVAALGSAYTQARMRLNDLREAVVDANLSLKGASLAAQDARRALSDLLRGPDPRALADAHRAIEDALRSEQDAVQGLTAAHQALQDLLKPAEALDVADARDAIADATRNEERARLNLNKQLEETNAILNAEPRRVTDEQRARARLDLADAENAVADSSRDTARARQRLRELEAGPDMAAVEAARRRISEAEYAVAQAARSTADARTDLAEVEQPATALEVAQARHNVALAENALADAQRDRGRAVRELTEADRLGLERAPEIVEARESIRQATLAVTDAELDQKRAVQALTDAQISARESMAQMGIAAANLNEDMNKLPPAAQAFVRTLIEMKPRLDAIRSTAAAGFFSGATEGLNAAMGSFNEVNAVIGQTSTVLGEAARKSGELVGSPAFGRDIAIIGGNNARVIDTLAEALRHVISAIRHVMVAAGPLTQWLADVINKWALNAAAAAKSGRETGKMADFFEKTRAIAQRLGSIIGHLASGLLGLGKAGFKTGNDIWAGIDRAAKRFDEWANSDEGRKKIEDFFRETKELAAALAPVIAGAGSALAFVALKMLPLTELLKVLGPATDEVVTAFIAFKTATIAWGVASATATFFTGGWTTAFWALNAAVYAFPGTWIVLAIAAVVAAGYLLIKNWDEVKAALERVWAWIKQAATDTFGWVTKAVSDSWNWIKQATTTTWNAISSILTTIWNAIKSVATTIFNAIKSVITGVWDGIKSITGTIWNGIRGLLSGAWEGIRSGATAAWGLIRDGIIDPIRSAAGKVSEIVGGLKSRVKSVFDDIVGFAKDFGRSVGNAITGAFAKVGGIVTDFAIQILKVIDLIPGVSMSGAIKTMRAGAKELGFSGYARGGLFAASGGMVTGPLVIAGEEAPLHPEIVIPSNPAYRDRARALLVQAAQMIGFAEGGVVDAFNSAVKGTSASAKPALALFEAGVVESGLRNLPYGDRDSRGALQVRDATARSMGLNNMDPRAVALAFLTRGYWGKGGAISLAGRNATASAGWVAQQVQGSAYPGRYDAARNDALRFMTGDVDGEEGGGILGKIAGALGSLLSKGASFLLDKLPGVGGLPDWLRGTGSWILETVGRWIKDKVSDVIGLGGGGGAVGGGVSGSIQGAMALARSMGLSITSTTGGQHAKNSWHYKGRAADVAGSPAQMAGFFNAALQRYGSHLLELFYDPLGAIDNGKRIPAIGGHRDHVHIALARGGIFGLPPYGGSFATGGVVPGPVGAARLIEAHAGEVVMPNGMQLHADIYIGGQRINELVDVRLEMRDRSVNAAWRAGLS